jgi:DNA-binding IclR family transcriptional regulator
VLEEERARPQAGLRYDDAALEAVIAETRSRGLSRTDGLLNIGFAALSAPVFGHDGELRGALTLIGPNSGMDASFSGPCARHLVRAAGALSAEFGWERP